MTARPRAARHAAEHPRLGSKTTLACGRRPSAPPELSTKPGADKLARFPTDALFDLLLFDDSGVGTLTARKHYGEPDGLKVAVR